MGTNNDVEVFRKYKNKCSLFIETGSYIGDGVQAAINAGFDEIISIEISEYQYNYCKDRFGACGNIAIVLGDSTKILEDILSHSTAKHKNIFFWLDAHNSGGLTGGGGVSDTAIKELETIAKFMANHKIQATICMDDINDCIKQQLDVVARNNVLMFIAKEPCINPQTNTLSENYIVVYQNREGND